MNVIEKANEEQKNNMQEQQPKIPQSLQMHTTAAEEYLRKQLEMSFLNRQELRTELQKVLSGNQKLTEENQNLRQELSEVQRINRLLTSNNDALRSNNGLMQRKEQESLIAEVKDVRARNCKLEQLVDMSCVEAVRAAEEKSKNAIQRAKGRERDAEQKVRKIQKNADKRIQSMTAKTREIQEKAQTREMIWAVGMIVTLSLGMVKNHSLLMDLEEALLLPLNLWNALVTYTGRAAIFIALTGTVVLGIAGIEILKAVKKTWSHLYLFYLILSMAITTAMGDLIKSYIPLNQVLIWMLLFLLLWLINRQISHRI